MVKDKDFFDIGELIEDFYTDSLTLLDNLAALFLKIDKESKGDQSKINEVKHALGPLHTIKGNAGMLGFPGLQEYVHEVEGVIKNYLESPDLSLAPYLIDFLFQVEKKIRKGVEHIKETKSDLPELLEEKKKVEKIKENLKMLAESISKETEEEESLFYRDTQLIKVDFSKLDKQINLLGELIIYRTRLDQIESKLLQKYPRDPDVGEMYQTAQSLGKKITDLQEAVMSLRLLPIKNLFNIVPRIVREEAKKNGKEIEVIITGEETELDKSVIDRLHEPLLHIIRNAVDHGIELPEERTKRGKNPVGIIRISARQESNFIIIEIEDDGRGIDVEEIHKIALEKGIIEKGVRPSDRELLNLIFTPGFSTSRVATTTSGRGVGLEVVAEVISSLGGSVDVETVPGINTKFTVKIPLTLAIITALMVEVGNEVYAIPTASVSESIRIKSSEIQKIRSKDVILLRGDVIPLLRLSDVVGLTLPERDIYKVVVIEKNEYRLGIAVERLVGQQEIVIKSLDESIVSPIIAGATILGNGRIVLILDIASLFTENKSQLFGQEEDVYRIL